MKSRFLVLAALASMWVGCEVDQEAPATGPLQPRPTASVRPASSLGIPSPSTEFEPATRTRGRQVVLPVTFPDGSRAEIVYPEGLDLAAMGPRPYGSGQLNDCCARDFFILYGGVSSTEAAGQAPIETFAGTRGEPVEYWKMWGQAPLRWLIFRFGHWYVLVWDDNMSHEQLKTWAQSLRGNETRDGFLRLRAHPPLALSPAGEHAGPELTFDGRNRWISFFVGQCRPQEPGRVRARDGGRGDEWFASRCVHNLVEVHVGGARRGAAERLVNDVAIRNVRLASG